jgi:transglutaminase-like putative cysteine protease
MPQPYSIQHVTRFTYDSPVSESVMELRMRPATEGRQRCLLFELDLEPVARVFAYQDFLGNWVHHFDLPRRHRTLAIVARAQVLLESGPEMPAALAAAEWEEIEDWAASGHFWDLLQPSRFAEWSTALNQFAAPIEQGARMADPLTAVRAALAAVHGGFEYAPHSTRVDSPIDEVLGARRGVCQDFTHVLLAVLRRLRLPSRYVSGYLAPADTPSDATIATHAWAEVRLPTLGWVGCDPTNGEFVGSRHIRVAVGRDYADVPPTRGVFKGSTATTLEVAVDVKPGEAFPPRAEAAFNRPWIIEAPKPARDVAQAQQ